MSEAPKYNMTKKARIELYYNGASWSWSLILIGMLLVLAGGIGLILIGWGIHRVRKFRRNMPTDHQMDEWVKDEMLVLADRSFQKFGISKESCKAGPLFVMGFPYLKDVALAGFKFRKGKDKRIRVNPFNVNVISIGSSQLFSYACGFDLLSGNAINESTHEIFLQDIVSVSTTTQSTLVNVERIGTIQANTSQLFQVTSSGGTNISTVLSCPEVIQRLGGIGLQFPLSDADKALSMIRQEVRARKVA